MGSVESQRIIRRQEVERLTGLTKPSIYAAMTAGTFPRSVQLSERSVGWRLAEVLAWVESRPRVQPRHAEPKALAECAA